MTIDKAKLDSLLDEAHKWLNVFNEFEIRPSIKSLIGQLDVVLKNGDYTSAWHYIERLQGLTDNIQDAGVAELPERSNARVECAIAAYRMGNLQEAIRLFETAIQIYGPKYSGHYEATARWMLGCVQWQVPHQEDNAHVSWAKSIEIYKRLADRSLERANSSRSAWYLERTPKMEQALELALQPAVPFQSPAASSSEHPPATAPVDPIDTPTVQASVVPRNDTLRLLFLTDEIRAGYFGPIGINPDILGYVDTDRFLINGVIHRIINLRGKGRAITLAQRKDYAVLRVNGESMNAVGIDDGDYVLLRFQDSPESNDIVAAIITGVETEATLKRFRRIGNEVILQFRSNSPRYKEADGRDKEFVFDQSDKGFRIAGVALAVFKPI